MYKIFFNTPEKLFLTFLMREVEFVNKMASGLLGINDQNHIYMKLVLTNFIYMLN